MKTIELLADELAMIRSTDIREFTEMVLSKVPEYFWRVPSSSTGKYHPPQSNGPGGLVRHTQAVVYFADKLCDVFQVIGKERDATLAGCILHDILKYGDPKEMHTTKTHDFDSAVFVQSLIDSGDPQPWHNTLLGVIAWHMGRWTVYQKGRKRRKIFPEDYTKPELIGHLADVISARKNVSLSHIEPEPKT